MKGLEIIVILCGSILLYQSSVEAIELRRHKRSPIFPGTKWCGPGNNAITDDDVAEGEGHKADICCRKHDHCGRTIPALSTDEWYNVINHLPYTMSHCDCDDALHKCLTQNRDEI